MTLCNHSSRIYMDSYDVDGAINALSRKCEESMSPEQDVYFGAVAAFEILRDHERISTQADFMVMFEAKMTEFLS